MRRKRRNHRPAFKAKLVLAALKGDRTLSELAEQFDVHQNQIQEWHKRLLENADSVDLTRLGASAPEPDGSDTSQTSC